MLVPPSSLNVLTKTNLKTWVNGREGYTGPRKDEFENIYTLL